MTQVLSHNLKSAATWGSGGASYDIVSQSIADAIDHVVNKSGRGRQRRFWMLRRARAGLRVGCPVGAQR